jgi:hypothetical protein
MKFDCEYCQCPKRFGLKPAEIIEGHVPFGFDQQPLTVRGHRELRPLRDLPGYVVWCRDQRGLEAAEC